MQITEQMLESIRSLAKSRLSEHRFIHTLGVEKMAAFLSQELLPHRVNELRAAALLHDITKEISYEEHKNLIKAAGLELSPEDLGTTNALHGFSAVGFIKNELPGFASDDILDAVYNHTLGNANMNLFSSIIFISDYTEENRTHESCRAVREMLIFGLKRSSSREEKLRLFYKACIASIDNTVNSLNQRGLAVNSRTLLTKNSFLSMI